MDAVVVPKLSSEQESYSMLHVANKTAKIS